MVERNLSLDEFEEAFGEVLYFGYGTLPEKPKNQVGGIFYKNKRGKIKFEELNLSYPIHWMYRERSEKTIARLKEMGFDFAKGHETMSTWSMFAHMIGQPVSHIPKYIEEYKSKNAKLRQDRKKLWDDWETVRDTFNNIVLGVDKEIDYYDTGFTVRIVLSHAPYQERRETLKNKKKELISYVMTELKRNRSFRQRVPSMDYFYPQEIFIFKSVAEAEIKFSIKSLAQENKTEHTLQPQSAAAQ